MSRALYRLAGASYRHWRLVLVACLLVTLALVSRSLLSWCTSAGEVSVPGPQSQQSLIQLAQAPLTLALPQRPGFSWMSLPSDAEHGGPFPALVRRRSAQC
jgi:hypothetical protein